MIKPLTNIGRKSPPKLRVVALPIFGGFLSLALAMFVLLLVDRQLRQAEEARALQVAARDLAMLPASAAQLGSNSPSALKVAVVNQRLLIEGASAPRSRDGQPQDPCAAFGRDPSVIAGVLLAPDPDSGGSTAPFGTTLSDPSEIARGAANMKNGERREIRFRVSVPAECASGSQEAFGQMLRIGDVVLIAGRLLDPGGRTRRVLISIALLTIALSTGATALIVLMVGRQTRRNLELLRSTLRAASAGDFDARVDGTVGGGAMGVLGDEIDRAIERIERLNHGFREIATKTAHDFRTPLTKARLGLELGLRRGGDRLEAAAKKALEQIDDLSSGFSSHLEMARTLGGEAVKLQAFDLEAVVRRVGELYADLPAAIDRDISILIETEPDAIPILAMGLERQIETAIANLLSNALKASPNEATIVVRVRRDKGEARVEIDDEGTGWPRDLEERLGTFGLKGRDADADSHGVGLASVIAVARLHGGRLERAESPSGGARAIFVLVATT